MLLLFRNGDSATKTRFDNTTMQHDPQVSAFKTLATTTVAEQSVGDTNTNTVKQEQIGNRLADLKHRKRDDLKFHARGATWTVASADSATRPIMTTGN
jgi:hypothetical protein